MVCNTCSEPVTDGANCGVCHALFHYTCIGTQETNYRKMNAQRKAALRCSDCLSSSESSQGTSAVLEELRSFRADFNSTKSQIQSIVTSIAALNSKWDEMETRFSELEDRIVPLENGAPIVSKLQSELQVCNEVIHNLQKEMLTRDQQARMNNVEISGIPFKKGENLMTIFNSICRKVGVNMANAVDSVHRVRRFVNKNSTRVQREDSDEAATTNENESEEPRPPAIIVKFTRRIFKDELLAAVRARRGLTTADIELDGPALSIFVGDHLTPANKLLLKRARQRKAELLYTYLWTRDCKILMRKNESSKIIAINSDSDLLKLK